jgi:hypothetical protein
VSIPSKHGTLPDTSVAHLRRRLTWYQGNRLGQGWGTIPHGLEDPLSINQQFDSGGRTSNLLASPWLSVQIPRQLLLQTQKFSMPCVMRVEVRP